VLYEVHTNLVAQWKKELLENAEAIFEKKGKEKNTAAEAEEKARNLYAQIGELKVENDFLKRRLYRVSCGNWQKIVEFRHGR